MKWLLRCKHRLARLLLRGRVLDWWLSRKARKLEAVYLHALSCDSRCATVPAARVAGRSGAALRRILFIADIQWESDGLVPELNKIADVRVWDLHPAVRRVPAGEFPGQTVAVALDGFIRSQPDYEPDVIVFYARPALLSDEAFHRLRTAWSCPLVGMNLDDKIEFLHSGVFASGNDNYQLWARQFDLNLSSSRAVVDWYAERNLPVLYLPEGYHPKFAGPPEAARFSRDLCFLGRCRPERKRLVGRLRQFGVPVETIGAGWPGVVVAEKPESIFRSSLINLGIGWAAPSETLTTLKGRDFECPGAGACYLTTYNWELPLHYELGKEILCYRSVEELVEIYRWYRVRPEDCLKIAQAAWRRSVAEHTWEQRFRKVFQQVGFKV